jgi:hypothetical protein
MNHFYFILLIEGYGCGLRTIGNQKPPVDNQNDFFMHFLVMSCNEQVARDGRNGQVFFY